MDKLAAALAVDGVETRMQVPVLPAATVATLLPARPARSDPLDEAVAAIAAGGAERVGSRGQSATC